ncbi:MAG: HEAT repeat domain-containing protein [Candidatus Paceibacterota bacterium]
MIELIKKRFDEKEVENYFIDIVGLRREELFYDGLYRVLGSTLNSHLGRFSNPFGVEIKAPDWNPDSKILCGKGLHFIVGHPFMIHWLASVDKPRFFKIPFENIRNIVIPNDFLGKVRAEAYFLYPENELNEDSPEFSQSLLYKIFKSRCFIEVRKVAFKMIKEGEFFASIACDATIENNFRIEAVRKLNPQNYFEALQGLALEDECVLVRFEATKKIFSEAILRQIILKENNFDIRLAARQNLKKLKTIKAINK